MAAIFGRRRAWRILRIAGAGLGCVVLVCAALAGTFFYQFMRAPAEPDFPPPADRAEANRQDLEYLQHVMTLDRSFAPEAREAFRRSVDQLAGRAAELDSAGFEMAVARAVALADNGHTGVRETGWGGRRLNSLPLRFAWFAEGLFIVKAEPAYADLLGARVVAVGGQTPEDMSAALGAYVGGAPSLARELAPNFMRSPAALHAAGLLPSPREAALALQLPDGSRQERVIGAKAQTPLLDRQRPSGARRALSPLPAPDDAGTWAHVLDGRDSLPLYLRNPDRFYWHAYAEEVPLVYIQINAVRDQGDVPLSDYLARLLVEIGEKKPAHAVVDLRFAPGGDYTLTADFTKSLAQQIPAGGKIFILTSGTTFSAALVTTARLKYFAGARGHIVGEAMGDRARFWAEGRRSVLPNSRIAVSYATGYHDWDRGCRSITRCYWINFLLDVPAGELSPDISAPIRFPDYMAGRDSAMEAVKAELRP